MVVSLSDCTGHNGPSDGGLSLTVLDTMDQVMVVSLSDCAGHNGPRDGGLTVRLYWTQWTK